MTILNNYYRGLICRCPSCYTVLGYGPEDIHNNSYVTCPNCKFEILTKMILNYDGVIREENADGTSTVQKQSGNGASNC